MKGTGKIIVVSLLAAIVYDLFIRGLVVQPLKDTLGIKG